MMNRPLRLGLIVNPLAGLGGRVGLKGSDGVADEAIKRGAKPVSGERAVRALRRLAASNPRISLIAARGGMGQEAAAGAGFLVQLISAEPDAETAAADTRAAASEMMAAAVDLVLFAGGDGTARDIFAVVADRVPMLGIPAGVKMHSAVFATSPEAAGEAVAALASSARVRYRPSEVMDIDEEAFRSGSISPRLYGYAKVPHVPLLLQNAKARNALSDDAAVERAAGVIARDMDRDGLYAIGPGRSAKSILAALGLHGTLLGTDLVAERRPIAKDANEETILAHAEGRTLRIIVGVAGGQGYVFGRGNQELSPAVIRKCGRDGITILASQQKLLALPDKRLLVDTGDAALDRELAGYWRVVVGPDEEMVMKVAVA